MHAKTLDDNAAALPNLWGAMACSTARCISATGRKVVYGTRKLPGSTEVLRYTVATPAVAGACGPGRARCTAARLVSARVQEWRRARPGSMRRGCGAIAHAESAVHRRCVSTKGAKGRDAVDAGVIGGLRGEGSVLARQSIMGRGTASEGRSSPLRRRPHSRRGGLQRGHRRVTQYRACAVRRDTGIRRQGWRAVCALSKAMGLAPRSVQIAAGAIKLRSGKWLPKCVGPVSCAVHSTQGKPMTLSPYPAPCRWHADARRLDNVLARRSACGPRKRSSRAR